MRADPRWNVMQPNVIRRVSILLSGLLVVTAAAFAPRQHRVPRFEDYPVGQVYRGHPAAVDLSSDPAARRFRTVLREGARRGPNFAGHYTVVEWGCGTSCHVFAIVDTRTGRVWIRPGAANLGAAYRLDSRLFIVDPPEMWDRAFGGAVPSALDAKAVYYRWTGTRLVAVDSVRARAGSSR